MEKCPEYRLTDVEKSNFFKKRNDKQHSLAKYNGLTLSLIRVLAN